jgi:group I intron endonuclease
MTSGIYKIRNLINGRIYIGSTINFDIRQQNHFNDLITGKYINLFLQYDFNKCGKEHFAFEIIENVPIENLLVREQFYINQYWDNCKNCYNISKIVGSPMRGRKHTEKAKQLMSVARSGANHYAFGVGFTEQIFDVCFLIK